MNFEHPSGISAECIAASTYGGRNNIYTLVTRSPKYIDAELRTHRMLSQNSSSSRAIPLKRMIEQVEQDPFVPSDWRLNQKGMQGYDVIEDDETICKLRQAWIEAMQAAVFYAKEIDFVHKQHVNRLLEPFAWQWKVITATEWRHFFDLRLAENAQPEIQILAHQMCAAIRDAAPRYIDDGWHMPFVGQDEIERYSVDENLMVSAARCARISYANHGTGRVDRDADIKLANSLIREGHMTPFEHQARRLDVGQESHATRDDGLWSGNFRGWLQHRKTIE